jgi:flavin reductase (DIM6/NTAB) family NADH-FMN oxidoreductase RutF
MEKELAQALASLTTGIYVLTVADGAQHHGMSSSWATQVSGEPPLLSAAVDNQHFSRAIIERTGKFGFNIVGRRGHELEDYFYSSAAKRADNLSGLAYEFFVGEPLGVRVNPPDRPLTSLELDYVYLGGREVLPRDRSGW